MCNKCTPVCEKPVPHVHANIIKQWADNPSIDIEYYNPGLKEWKVIQTPSWDSGSKYRIKPTPKPDIVQYIRSVVGETTVPYPINVWPSRKGVQKQTFDGETGDLKSSEIVQ